MPTPRRQVFVQPQQVNLTDAQLGGADVGAPSADLTEDVVGASSDVQNFALKQIEEADNLAIQTFKNRSDRMKLDIEARVSQTKGRDAFGAEDSATEEYNKFMSEMEAEGLTTRQKAAISAIRSKGDAQIRRSSRVHELGQIDKVKNQEFAAGAKNIIESGMMHWKDPERSFDNMEDMMDLVNGEITRQGLGEEAAEAFFKDRMGAYHKAVFNKMLLEKDKDTARAYLGIVEEDGQVNDSLLDEMEASLKEADFRGESQSVSDSIMNSSASWDDRFEKARQIEDAEKRAEVTRLLKAEFQLDKALKAEAQNNTFMDATNLIEANPGKSARELVAPSEWNKLTLGQRQALQRHADFSDPAKKPKQDWNAFFEFYDLSSVERSKLSELQFRTKYWSKLDKASRNKVFSQWRKDKDAEVKGILSVEDHMNNELKELGWKPAKGAFKKDSDALRYQRFTEGFDEWLKVFRSDPANKGSDPTKEVIQKKVRELTGKTFNASDEAGFFSSEGFSIFGKSKKDLKELFNAKDLKVSLNEARGGLTSKQIESIKNRLKSSQQLDENSEAFREKIRRIGAALRIGTPEMIQKANNIISGREN